MPVYRLHVDSTYRDPYSTSSDARFTLSKTICDVKSVRVRFVMMCNSLFNISSNNAQLYVSKDGGQTYNMMTIPHGFYTPDQVVDALHILLEPTAVTRNDNILSWHLPPNIKIDISRSNARDMLGLGSIIDSKTYLCLVAPMSVAFTSPQLQDTSNVLCTAIGGASTPQSFLIVPLKTTETVYYEPSTVYSIDMGGRSLSSLDIRVVYPMSGIEIREMTNWILELEIYT